MTKLYYFLQIFLFELTQVNNFIYYFIIIKKETIATQAKHLSNALHKFQSPPCDLSRLLQQNSHTVYSVALSQFCLFIIFVTKKLNKIIIKKTIATRPTANLFSTHEYLVQGMFGPSPNLGFVKDQKFIFGTCNNDTYDLLFKGTIVIIGRC